MKKTKACPICQGYMLQNMEAVEYLKCPTCGYGEKKVNFGKACGNCQCINGKTCKKLDETIPD